MPKDRNGHSKRVSRTTKVTASLPGRLTAALDEEVERRRQLRPRAGESRASVVRAALRALLLRAEEDPASQEEVRENLQTEAELMEAEAELLMKAGDGVAARSLWLMAAAKELEGLSVMTSPSEPEILRTVIRVVMLFQKGTGYKSLPRVPPSR